MNAPVLAFFNNKGGVGKTSLVYHMAWMLAELDHSVLAVDLDPQANLTAAFLDEDHLEALWDDSTSSDAATIYKCVAPLTEVSDLLPPDVYGVAENLHLIPGDLSLSSFEDHLSTAWPGCFDSKPYRHFRVISAFWQVIKAGVEQCHADLVLVDVGPSLGAINRSALIATDSVVVPLGADLFSRQGLRNLGPTLRRWRGDWKKRMDQCPELSFELPRGHMRPVGYIIQQHGVRLSRPVKAYDRWANQMPAEYRRHVMDESGRNDLTLDTDAHCVATVKHYRSLVPLGQDARKPIFSLAPADGAIGSHALAARQAHADFRELAQDLLERLRAQDGSRPTTSWP